MEREVVRTNFTPSKLENKQTQPQRRGALKGIPTILPPEHFNLETMFS
jgi:hypothetical protein